MRNNKRKKLFIHYLCLLLFVIFNLPSYFVKIKRKETLKAQFKKNDDCEFNQICIRVYYRRAVSGVPLSFF